MSHKDAAGASRSGHSPRYATTSSEDEFIDPDAPDVDSGRCIICDKPRNAINKWATIRDHNDGWFFQKDGLTYCPEHVPDWVEAWRAKRG